MEVLLDAWGIGKKVCLNKKCSLEIASGLHGFSGVGFRHSLPKNVIPPMIHTDKEYVDLAPFMLFEKVYIDKNAYSYISNNRFTPQMQEILQKLKDDGNLVVINYKKELEPHKTKIIKESLCLLRNTSIHDVAIKSAAIWKEYIKRLNNSDNHLPDEYDDIDGIDEYISAFRGDKELSEQHLQLLEHQLWDVKCMQKLSNIFKCPVYHWDDYYGFYDPEILKKKTNSSLIAKDNFNKIWSLYIPASISTSPEIFQKIYYDSKIADLRHFIQSNSCSFEDIDTAFIDSIQKQLVQFDAKVNHFAAISCFLFGLIGLVAPEVSAVGSAASFTASEITKKLNKNRYNWHYYLSNAKTLFERKYVEKRLKR